MAANARLICHAADLADGGPGVRFTVDWRGTEEAAFAVLEYPHIRSELDVYEQESACRHPRLGQKVPGDGSPSVVWTVDVLGEIRLFRGLLGHGGDRVDRIDALVHGAVHAGASGVGAQRCHHHS